MDELLQKVIGHEHFRKIALAIVFFAVAGVLLYRAFFPIRYPADLPRLGKDEGISWRDMRKKFQTDCTAVFEEAYEKYSKRGKTVLIPVFGPHDEVILPPSALHWLCKQPDNVASSLAAQIDSIQPHHSLGHKFAHDPWGGMLIKTDLNSALEAVCAVMNNELGAAFDAVFGTDTENWKEIELFPACRIIGGRATLRFTLGDSPEGRRLCKDEEFVQSCYNVLDGMLDTAGDMAAARKFLRPILGLWASRNMPAKLKDLQTRFEPLYRERMQILEQQATNKEMKVPQDVIQMMLQYAIKERREEALSVEDMTKRLAMSNFGTMHQTIITVHNLFLNVLDSDREFNTMSVLRDEVARIIGDEGEMREKHWTRAKVSSMTKADSVTRETLRINSFIGRTVQRLVVAPGGLVTEDGIHLPQGTMVSILAHQSQTDGETFTDPFKYDPWRFSRPREAAADKVTGKPGLNNLSFVSTSSDYLAFSHGKHACPGRFLVDFELKMIMAYAVMNYDIEFPESYGGKRPANTWFVGFGIPPLDVKVRVKRKKTA
ncbi:cytochrome P450 [Pseudomassariella vexata]|uniref:Cytochrome P450 n=1 Tax=Pseudomassariella vexata TaxID=1141098 RepID=A0A1Y2E8C3_9PEZI|nr:cytochrome P450 [Pseudomassariella vexata]ORY67789.1 cytochrome P450 [Pseudomassariella vexata]